jgi:predicted SAM-dependent methyltransferase
MKAAGASTVTYNQQGRTTLVPNEVMEQFIEFATNAKKPILDIGAAFGVATLPALNKGARVIANDIDARHLEKIDAACPSELRKNLELREGHFLRDLKIAKGGLSAILASQVLHFLSGEELELAAQQFFSWLAPGGKIFTISGTVFTNNLKKLIPLYEERKSQHAKWPGEFLNLQSLTDDRTVQELPSFFHALDEEVLRRTFERVGFRIDECCFFNRKGVPEYVKLDGRENVILIGTKEK